MKSDGTIIFSKTPVIINEKWSKNAKETEIDNNDAETKLPHRYSQRLRNKFGEITDTAGGETTADTRIENLI